MQATKEHSNETEPQIVRHNAKESLLTANYPSECFNSLTTNIQSPDITSPTFSDMPTCPPLQDTLVISYLLIVGSFVH